MPGHTGIRGNECADEAAKAALISTVSSMKCAASDFIPELTMHYRSASVVAAESALRYMRSFDTCIVYTAQSSNEISQQSTHVTLGLSNS